MKDQDLLSIKEFSRLTGIKQSKLRYYDKIKLFRPIKRGENGYRYYSAMQTIMVNCINVMQSLNIPVNKYIAFKNERTPQQIFELLKKHEWELNKELLRLQQAYALLHTYTGLIQEGLLADEHSIRTGWMAAMPLELGLENDFSTGYLYDSFFSFINKMKERKIDPAYPAGGYYENMDTFIKTPGQPTRFFSHVPTGRDEKEAGEYLIGYTRGYYGNL
ncbi:MAG: MerR family DNA-binding transcriptional regulator, partial [Oscillospiraceae bacterium]|nr:MerR family DNA-binding transcriptional regulator [Oscillospiraceae bacterium]